MFEIVVSESVKDSCIYVFDFMFNLSIILVLGIMNISFVLETMTFTKEISVTFHE